MVKQDSEKSSSMAFRWISLKERPFPADRIIEEDKHYLEATMHIIIGATNSVEATGKKGEATVGALVEARILQTRPPRKGRGAPPDGQSERRAGMSGKDPEGGRVMLLLIPEGHKLPKDLSSGNYRVFLKFTRKGL